MTDNTTLGRRAFLGGAAGVAVASGAPAGAGVAAAQEETATGGEQGTGTGSGGTGTSGDAGGDGGGGTPAPSGPPEVPQGAKALGIAVTIAMITTVGLSLFFLRFGGDYGADESE